MMLYAYIIIMLTYVFYYVNKKLSNTFSVTTSMYNMKRSVMSYSPMNYARDKSQTGIELRLYLLCSSVS